MKDTGKFESGKPLSLPELHEMAKRQRNYIEMQQQTLVAKEQRLKYLKQQDNLNHHQTMADYERLQRLREKVEAQESKLRKLRAQRGQRQSEYQYRNNPMGNNGMASDLASIRNIFAEKEKELSLAVLKVDELTQQLEEFRTGRYPNRRRFPQMIELERLRKEIAYRKQLNDQQNNMIKQQRAQLTVGRNEIEKIDLRISELQDRLARKRQMNQQLANQLSAATLAKQAQLRAIQGGVKNKNKPVSTVEPFLRSDPEGNQNNNVVKSYNNDVQFRQSTAMQVDTESNVFQRSPMVSNGAGNNLMSLSVAKKIEQLKQEKENSNVAFADNLPHPPPPILQQCSSTTVPLGLLHKPTNSVAPVSTVQSESKTVLGEQSQTSAFNFSEPSIKIKPVLPPKPSALVSSKFVANDEVEDEAGTSVDEDAGEERLQRSSDLPLTVKMDPVNNCGPFFDNAEVLMANHANRRIEIPPAFHFPEDQTPPKDLMGATSDMNNAMVTRDLTDNANMFPMMSQIYKEFDHLTSEEKFQLFGSLRQSDENEEDDEIQYAVPEVIETQPDLGASTRKVILKKEKSAGGQNNRHISFDPLALLLDASLEGELDLVKETALQVDNASAANDEGITALHNSICAGHFDIVKFLVEFGCDVNAQDSDGWTPLHCAASCNNLPMVRFLAEHGASLFAVTLSDHETAVEKCEEFEEGFDGCSKYLYAVQEKLGVMSGAIVFAVYDFEAQNDDEISFELGEALTVLRQGDTFEWEWWWVRKSDGQEGYAPRNLFGMRPRIENTTKSISSRKDEFEISNSNQAIEQNGIVLSSS